jgi:hypothetical protein
MVEKSKREEIIEVVNRLFIYTDEQKWKQLISEVFCPNVVFDMSSLGGEPARKLSSEEICRNWKEGFSEIDSIHHQAGNYIVTLREEGLAEVLCYAIAIHYKKDTTKGTTREFVGTYNLMLQLTDMGWRINGFRYNVKYVTGNIELR